MHNKAIKWGVWLFLAVVFAFYALHATRAFSWIFIPDSGDWLTASHQWIVAQPVGYPLYTLLGHVINYLPGSLEINLVVLLSCLASTVTVALTYIIIKKTTNNILIAITCAGLLCASAVFLTQSTIVEQYALLTMLLTAAFWAWTCNKKLLVGVFLGLAISVHIFALIIALLWLCVLWKERRQWVKPVIVCAAIVVVMYGYILVMMALPTPKLLAGGLNFAAVKSYLFDISGGIVGTMSVFEAPRRFLMIGGMLLVSFSVALIPAIKAVKPLNTMKLLLLTTIIYILWYVLTCIDPITWHYLIILTPPVIILAGIGLDKMALKYTLITLGVACVLICANGTTLDANALTQADPQAQEYYEELMTLPNNAIVVTEPGQFSLGLFYAMSNGKQLVPLIYPYMEIWHFTDYVTWLKKTYPTLVIGSDTLTTIQDNLGKEPIYYVGYPDPNDKLQPHLTLLGEGLITPIEGVK